MHSELERARFNRVIFGTLLPTFIIAPVGLIAFYVLVVRVIALRGDSGEGFAGLGAGVTFMGTLCNLIPLFSLFLIGHFLTTLFTQPDLNHSYFFRGMTIQSLAFALCAATAIALFFLGGVTIIPISR